MQIQPKPVPSVKWLFASSFGLLLSILMFSIKREKNNLSYFGLARIKHFNDIRIDVHFNSLHSNISDMSPSDGLNVAVIYQILILIIILDVGNQNFQGGDHGMDPIYYWPKSLGVIYKWLFPTDVMLTRFFGQLGSVAGCKRPPNTSDCTIHSLIILNKFNW